VVVVPNPDRGRSPESGCERDYGKDRAALATPAARGLDRLCLIGAREHRRTTRQQRRLRLPYARRSPRRLATVGKLRARPSGQFRIDER
jgi:hypothetical protein